MTIPSRVFLDTNVYIVGVANFTSAEWKILQWLGFESRRLKITHLSTQILVECVSVSVTHRKSAYRW